MTKIIAILNVVAWSGFWAFGYLAVTGEGGSAVVASLLAFVGAGIGIWAYLQLARHAEAKGYASPQKRTVVTGAGPVNAEEPL